MNVAGVFRYVTEEGFSWFHGHRYSGETERVNRRLIVLCATCMVLACGDDNPFAACPVAGEPEALEVGGRFKVELDYADAHSPGRSFRAFVSDTSYSGIRLRACQLDDEGLMWRFDTVWTGIPPRSELPAPASFPLGRLPTLVTGGMTRCLDEQCAEQKTVLEDVLPLSRDAISIADFSEEDGAFAGFMIQTVGRTADGSALVQVDFDLHWDPARVP